HARWLDIYVRPQYAERYLYNQVFAKSRSIHSEAFNRIDKARTVPFDIMAQDNRFILRRLKINPRGVSPVVMGAGVGLVGSQALSVHPVKAGEEDPAKLIQDVLSKMQPGQVSRVLEWKESFSIMKLISVTGDEYDVEVLATPKMDFEEWFKRQAASI